LENRSNELVAVDGAKAAGGAALFVIPAHGVRFLKRITDGKGHSVANVDAFLHWRWMIR
jgi:hypothetical protein